MELKEIKFTKEEFDMLIKGIECLPHQDRAEDLMSSLLDSVFDGKLSDDMKAKRDADKARKSQKKEMEKENLKENCWILQSKLIQLRRFMEQNNILMEAQDIINGNS